MKNKKKLAAWLLAAIVLVPALMLINNTMSNAEKPELSKVVFFVS